MGIADSHVSESLGRLDARWAATRDAWPDRAAERFEREHIDAIRRDGVTAKDILASLQVILDNARQAAP